MFYVMYLSSGKSFNEIKDVLVKYLPEVTVNANSESEFVLSHDSFTLRATNEGNNILFASEDYGHKFDYCLWFEIIVDCENWAEELIQLTDKILNSVTGIFVLESNGEKPFIYRNCLKLFVDKELGGSERFPFEILTLDWEEKELIRE